MSTKQFARACPVCLAQSPEDKGWCQLCGADLRSFEPIEIGTKQFARVCPVCLAQGPEDKSWCQLCGTDLRSLKPIEVEQRPRLRRSPNALAGVITLNMLTYGIVGFIVGGLIALILRPSAPLIGQLPIETVFSRGTGLSGLDVILVPTAERSFNLMLLGALMGLAAGMAASKLTGVGVLERTSRKRPLRQCAHCAEMIQIEAVICRYCDRPT